jgi:AcrR family transcriptional regulator
MSSAATPVGTRRERQRQATVQEIVQVSRQLLTDPAGLSLRAVAQRMGITAPALYRYVDNYQDLVFLVAADIDAETAATLVAAKSMHPDDDPAAQLISAGIAFRRWALSHRGEFALVFANSAVSPVIEREEDIRDQQTGLVFTDLLAQLWLKYQFPIPAVEDLDPAVAATLDDPVIPAKVDQIPESARGLLWVFMQSWAALYGTVTLEVFGHCDRRIIESGALFRSMLSSQASLLGIDHELARLQPMIGREMAQ